MYPWYKTLLYESASAAIWSMRERPRPLRLLFTSAHNAISFYFAPLRYRLRSYNAAGWRSWEKKGSRTRRKKGGISVPFPALPRLRANESQVDFSPTFLRFCAKRTVRSRARLCIDLGANVADIFLLLDRVVRNKRKWRYIFQNWRMTGVIALVVTNDRNIWNTPKEFSVTGLTSRNFIR